MFGFVGTSERSCDCEPVWNQTRLALLIKLLQEDDEIVKLGFRIEQDLE